MGHPPDLCILGYDFRASGVVRNALRIAAAAHRAGLATEMWVARAAGPLLADVPDGVPVRDAGHHFAAAGRTIDLARSISPLAAYLRQARPRIALSSGNHMHVAAECAYWLAGRPRDVSLWARASNATLKAPIGSCLGGHLPRPAELAIDAANRLQYAGFERIIAVCHELGDHLAGDLGIPASSVTVIPNGVDVAKIARMALAPADHPWMAEGQQPVILSAGRISRQKNFGDLIRAIAIVHRLKPVRLVILGDGTEQQLGKLRALANQLGIGGSVLLPGFDPNPFRWMARSAVFAISSQWEGASNVALEALAAGVPTVAYRCPTGISEVLEPLDAPSLVPRGDVGALADAIIRQLGRPRDSARLRAHAARFDLAATMDAYTSLFQDALRLKGTGAPPPEA